METSGPTSSGIDEQALRAVRTAFVNAVRVEMEAERPLVIPAEPVT